MVFLIFSFLLSCQSTSKKVVRNKGTVLSGDEFSLIAEKFSHEIANFINEKRENNPGRNYFLALLPTKNNTLNNLPLDVLEFKLVNNLLKKKVFVIRREDRKQALDEIELQLFGLSGDKTEIGAMKTPDFFIKMKIEENYLQNRREKLVEQTILLELRNIATQLVEFSHSVEFFKEKKTSRSVVW